MFIIWTMRLDSWNEGNLVRIILPNNLSAGDRPVFGSGHARCAWIAMYGSSPLFSAFFKSCLMVSTALSAMPFDFGYVGPDVVWVNSHSFLNSLNSLLLNCGPLSDMTFLGVPCRANMDFSF